MHFFFRIGKTTNCVQHIFKRVHAITLPQQMSVLQTQTNLCCGSNWTFYHTRSFHTGVRFCSRNDGQKDTDKSVSRSPYTPPSSSAAQKGTCITENYRIDRIFSVKIVNTIVMIKNWYWQAVTRKIRLKQRFSKQS